MRARSTALVAAIVGFCSLTIPQEPPIGPSKDASNLSSHDGDLGVITGRIEIDGQLERDVNGRFRLTTVERGRASDVPGYIAVTHGEWRTAVPNGSTLRFYEIEIDGAPAATIKQTYETVLGTTPLVVRVVMLFPVVLECVDAESGNSVANPEVFAAPDNELDLFSTKCRCDTSDLTRIEVALHKERVSLAPIGKRLGSASSVQVYITSFGYCVSRARIDFSLGGTLRVVLCRSSSLRVRVLPAASGHLVTSEVPSAPSKDVSYLEKMVLRLRRIGNVVNASDGASSGEKKAPGQENREPDVSTRVVEYATRVTDAEAVLARVLPGRYAVWLEVDGVQVTGRDAPRQFVNLEAGIEAELSVQLPKSVSAARGRDGGATFLVGDGWELASLTFEVTRRRLGRSDAGKVLSIDDLARDPDNARRLVWASRNVLEGNYEVYVRPCGITAIVSIPSSRFGVLEDVVIPPRATLELSVVDAATRQRADVSSIDWWCERGTEEGGVQTVDCNNGVGGFSLFAPATKIRVRLGPGKYVPSQLTVDMTSKEKTISWFVDRAPVIRIALSFQGRCIRWGAESILVCARSVNGGGHILNSTGSSELELTIALSSPGEYEVVLPRIPGFRLPDSFRVDVPNRGEVLRVVELSR